MQKRPRMAFPRHLSDVIHESLAESGLGDRLRETEIWRIWPDVVGAALVSRTQPLRIINGTLTVAVSGAPWLQELRFMTDMLKEKLNSRLGADIVNKIVLKAGSIHTQLIEKKEEPPVLRHITPQQLSRIKEQAADIADLETRLAFIDLMKTSMEQPN